VVSSGEVPDDDLESLFDGAGGDGKGGKKRRERETGFANTALGGGGARREGGVEDGGKGGEGEAMEKMQEED